MITQNIINYWLANDLLLKADSMSMAHSIELRSPFLDLELASFLSNLNVDHKISLNSGKLQRKYILRTIMKDKLPAMLFELPKKGFSNPFESWLSTYHSDTINEEFKKDTSIIPSIFCNSHINETFELAKNGEKTAQRNLYNWYLLSKWIANN